MTSTRRPRRHFNQTERITARLRDLVRSYPKGLGLVKEFLQNADDAGASHLRFTYDRRRHPGHLGDAEKDVVLGSALLFTNERAFTEEDLQNIQHIGDGGKLHQARGTGRFGQGFNACYSVSDHPSLVTRDLAVWFDPHWRAHGDETNAWAWTLADAREMFPAWIATFAPGGLVDNTDFHNGTIFRLPLRSPADAARSKILAEAFTDQDFDTILDDVRSAGPSLLIFLRSVQTLTVDEIMPDGLRRVRYALTTVNRDDVEAARATVRDAVLGEPARLLDRWRTSTDTLPVSSYLHEFEVTNGPRITTGLWAVVSGLFRGPDDTLLKQGQAVCAHNEKALPWAGAAAPFDSEATAGGVACFLPLPEPAPWPVLLHGWFDLDSRRQGITRQPEAGETNRIRAEWNHQLLRHGVAAAWVMLIERLQADGQMDTEPYRRWPRASAARDDHDRALVSGFYSAIGTKPVFQCVSLAGRSWRSLEGMGKDFWTLDAQWHDKLRDPLAVNGITLLEPPLPTFVVEALRKTAHPAATLSPEKLRGALRLVSRGRDVSCSLHDPPPCPALGRSEWVANLFGFCALDGLDKLADLPLALLSDGKLHTFNACGTIYLVGEAERRLLAHLPRRMLAQDYLATIGLTDAVPALKVKRLDVSGLASCVSEITGAQIPDADWLTSLFDYLEQCNRSEVAKNKAAIQSLPILPDQQGRRFAPGCTDTPVYVEREQDVLRQALIRLGVPILSGPEVFVRSVMRFALRHSDFVWRLTPDRLAWALHSHVQTPWMNIGALADRNVLGPILDFLSPPTWLGNDDQRAASFCRLPIFPTIEGAVVSAESNDLFVPKFDPPAGLSVRQTLLDVGSDGRWAALFHGMGIPERDGAMFIRRGILPSFSTAAFDEQLRMLRWMRDHLRAIEAELAPDALKDLSREVRSTKMLPLTGGGFGAPKQTYRPDAKEAIALLGTIAKVPDVSRLEDEPKLWESFFVDLDLLSTPQPDHLAEAIERCIADAGRLGTSAVKERLKTLREYIGERWDSLSDPKKIGSKKFVSHLATLAWLPATPPESAAAAAIWPDRLFKANEISSHRLLHLVASVFPVVDGTLPMNMAKALQVQTEVSVDIVLRHLDAVRGIPFELASEATQNACRTTFARLLEFVAELPEKDGPSWKPKLAALSERPTALLRGRWWRPKRVFLESLPFQTDWCVSLLEEPTLAGRLRVPEGLGRLGARSKPEPSDWVEMLAEVQRADPQRVLTDGELGQVRATLQQLRLESREWLHDRIVYVPTRDRHLLPTGVTLLPDDPRLKRALPLCSLPLVEEVEVSLDIAGRAGARSLQQVLEDELAEEPVRSQDADALRWAEESTRRLRSSAFSAALRRLAWHEAASRGEDPATAANAPALTLPHRLALYVARNLSVTSAFPDTGEIVFEQFAGHFWDRDAAILWLTQGGKRKMGDELARTIAMECGLDALRISRILEVEPEEVANLLDEDGIAEIPVGDEGYVAPSWAPPPNVPPMPAPEDRLSDENDGATRTLERSEVSVDSLPSIRQATAGDAVLARQGRHTAGGGRGGSAGSALDSLTKQSRSNEVDPAVDPPTTPGLGSSRPWSPETPAELGRGGRRLRSFVHPVGQQDYDTGRAMPQIDHEVQRLARQRVVAWEKERGRAATEVGGSQQGCDLESLGPEGTRYIAVRGIDGPWTARGVGLNGAEFAKAFGLGPSWWLYVVEYARGATGAKVLPLVNPFLEATEHRFDSGWRALAAVEESLSEDPTEGERVTLEDGRTAIVIEAEPRGQLWRVTLRFPNEQEEVRPWRSSWRRG